MDTPSTDSPIAPPARWPAPDAVRLLDQWRAGDAGARDALLRLVHPHLYRWALAYAADADEADDIAQRALVTVYEKIHQYRAEAPFAAWLYRITIRAAAQRRRTRARRATLDQDPRAAPDRTQYTTDPGSRVDRERMVALVRACYDALPPRQRAALSLVDLEGYTPTEAAVMLDISAGALRASLFKARAAIRRQVFALSPAVAERFTSAALPALPEVE